MKYAKTCSVCKQTKDNNEFEPGRRCCRKCRSSAYKEYYIKNKIKRLKYNREYRLNNIGAIRKREKEYEEMRRESKKKYRKEYYAKNKEKLAAKKKEYAKNNKDKLAEAQRRYRKDIKNRIASNIRCRMYYTIKAKRTKKRWSCIKELGCTVEELVMYFEGKFHDGMSWENYGTMWHIDHIRPLSWFDLSNTIEFKIACHYTNLQPMLASDNWSKGARHM